jgi:TPR repeat protein
VRAIRVWILLLAAAPAYASLPPGITSKALPDNVVLYERAASAQQLPSFWDSFFDLFRIQKDRTMPLPFRRSIALLVGIGNYRYLTPHLEYTARDVEKMRDYLLGEGGFDAVYVMDERATPQLLDSYMMDKLPSLLAKEDRFLFYFSGHGGDPGGGYPLLQFRDAQPGQWGHDVLRVDQFQLWSNRSTAKHMLFIFDSCFAGEALAEPKEGNTEAGSIAELSANGNRTVVTAGTAEQRAWMLKLSSDNGYSIFTDALLRALRDGAADRKNRGFVTIEQAVAEAQVQLAEVTRKLGPGHEMKPQPAPIDPRRKGTFVFLNPKAQKPSIPPGDATFIGVTVAKGVGPEQNADLELAFWKSVEPLKDPELYAQVCQHFHNGIFCPIAHKLIDQLKSVAPAALASASLTELERLAGQKVRGALTQLGKAYESGIQGAPKDPKAAIKYYAQAADLGDGDAAYRLGEIYWFGRQGISADMTEAARWYRNATDLGNASGMASLAVMYANGTGGLAKDERKAGELCQKAADLGDAHAMGNLGVMYEQGKGGLAKDERKAVELYEKAADLGDADGMAYLGDMYEHGKGGLSKDERKAVELYQKAVDLGDGWAMVKLGVMYEGGEGGFAQNEKRSNYIRRLPISAAL